MARYFCGVFVPAAPPNPGLSLERRPGRGGGNCVWEVVGREQGGKISVLKTWIVDLAPCRFCLPDGFRGEVLPPVCARTRLLGRQDKLAIPGVG